MVGSSGELRMNGRWGGAWLMVFAIGCGRASVSPRPVSQPMASAPSEPAKATSYLDGLAAEADRAPRDRRRRKASGLAHLRAALATGEPAWQDRAELDLEAVLELDPTDEQVARALGRFYNLRAVQGDGSRAEAQARAYALILGDAPNVDSLDRFQFSAWCFAQMGRILHEKLEGRLFAALAHVRAVEQALSDRVARDPLDGEARILRGNFAVFFAGHVPMGKRERVETAVDALLWVREHWADVPIGNRDPGECPNTYENLMFELAEGLMVIKRVDEAATIYSELAAVPARSTMPQRQIAAVAEERLAHLDDYAGDMSLMPPWPSDGANCSVCHAYDHDVAWTSLYTRSTPKLDMRAGGAPQKAPNIVIDSDVRAVIDARCVSCHQPGREGGRWLDLTLDEEIKARWAAMAEHVKDGTMPPEHSLSADEVAILNRWKTSYAME